ncbi:gp065 [Rhodococcus phage ReqiDocB7]|uniref:gp065 n=1 Tax=Rhodococcus phage ReqiDocB7 TaxID=691966 RepID=UPI0001CDD85A|nr:gp065 [Rhodococcus phage ReqiDocB7]ADD80851.1 gp065 [Rhodococcus phage ReqiDocB7]
MQGFDFTEMVRKEFAHKGTGNYPVVILDPNSGLTYVPKEVKTDQETKATILIIEEV